jgi:DNA polymerase-3 subunit alpha
VLEALITAGAMDALGANRASLLAALPDALKAADQRTRDGAAGQVDLFGIGSRVAAPPPPMPQSARATADRQAQRRVRHAGLVSVRPSGGCAGAVAQRDRQLPLGEVAPRVPRERKGAAPSST